MATEQNPNAHVQRFLAQKKCLVADAGSTSRNSLRKMLSDLGALASNVFGSDNLAEARDLIVKQKPTVLIVADRIENGDGMQLLEIFRKEVNCLPHERIIFFLASEGLNSVTAQAAASIEVDTLIVRPFSLDRIHGEFRKVVSLKSMPLAYSTLVARASGEAREGRWDNVLASATEAQKLHARPVDALVLEARARLKTAALKEAIAALTRALSIDSSHLPSLAMLATVQLAMKSDTAALPLVLQLKAASAIDPPMIPAILRMAGSLLRYDIIEELALNIENLPRSDRTDTIQKDLAESVIRLATHKLTLPAEIPEERVKGAIEWFKRAIRIGGGGMDIHMAVFRAMAAATLFQEIEVLMASAPPEVRDSPESKLLYLEYMNRTADTFDVLRVADDLRRQKIFDPRVYEVMLLRSVEMKRPARVLRNLLDEACEKNPSRAKVFREMVPAQMLVEA